MTAKSGIKENLRISSKFGKVDLLEKRLQQLAEDILTSYFENKDVLIGIALVDARKMRVLNRNFRGLDRATNVLSFETPRDFPVPPKSPKLLGEVYLCPSVIKERGEDIEFLLVHGLLHLLGFDHDNSRARMSMQKLEQKILIWLKNRS